MKLTPSQFTELHTALLDAFTTADLRLMLMLRLGQQLDDLADVGQPRPNMFSDVIQKTENFGWAPTLRLVNSALQSRPENLKLVRMAQQLELTGLTPALEREVRKGLPALDFDQWVVGGSLMQARVCQVIVTETGRVERGTGFLVGPDVVLTNYHVVVRVINKEAKPASVELKFDYKFLGNGTRLNKGTSVRLVDDPVKWLIDFAPDSKVDTQIETEEGPGAEELDYVLLRVADSPGTMPINAANAESTAKPRGWIDVPEGEVTFQEDDPILIIQHLAGGPVKVVIETKAVLKDGLNANRTRVRYSTNTEEGSSGAPCFDLEWRLRALHHSGDPNRKRTAQWNEGIPIDAIVRLANARAQALGLPSPWGKQE